MAAILDINDCELGLWQDGECRLASPGYAVLQGKDYQFGLEAHQQARLHPRSINHRFWWQLNTDPLQPSFGPARHSADLVHGHLQQIHQQARAPEQLILAVPGSMQSEQLSLLLGIVQQCKFDVVGIIDRAVTASCSQPLAAQCNHFELHLHQALITHIDVGDEQAQRRGVVPVPGAGWLALQDSVSNSVADIFIKQTRFDPRRKAASEQALYDQLPAILEQIGNNNEFNIELAGHRARIERQTLEDSCRELCDRIIQGLEETDQQVLLDPRLALMPGLLQRLPKAHILDSSAVSSSINKHLDIIQCEPSELRFITRLPAQTLPANPPVPTPTNSPTEMAAMPAPTAAPSSYHIEFSAGRYTVYPGEGEPPRVNGQKITGLRELQPGDQLEVDGAPGLTLATSGNESLAQVNSEHVSKA